LEAIRCGKSRSFQGVGFCYH